MIWPRLFPLLARHRRWLVGVPAAVLVTALLVYVRFAWLSHEYTARADRALDRGDVPEAVAWLQKASAIELPVLGWHLEARDRLRGIARDPEGQDSGAARMAAIVVGDGDVGRPDPLKGQALVVFVTVRSGVHCDDELRGELREHVAKEIGPFAKPDDIVFSDGLPKTRSGKIMRRLLREVAAGGEVKGDTTTLEDFSVIARLRGIED